MPEGTVLLLSRDGERLAIKIIDTMHVSRGEALRQHTRFPDASTYNDRPHAADCGNYSSSDRCTAHAWVNCKCALGIKDYRLPSDPRGQVFHYAAESTDKLYCLHLVGGRPCYAHGQERHFRKMQALANHMKTHKQANPTTNNITEKSPAAGGVGATSEQPGSPDLLTPVGSKRNRSMQSSSSLPPPAKRPCTRDDTLSESVAAQHQHQHQHHPFAPSDPTEASLEDESWDSFCEWLWAGTAAGN